MTNAYRTEYQVTDSGVTLRAKVGIAPISLQKFLDLDVCWTVSNSGAVTLALHAERNTVFPELPRFGLRLFLPKEMARVSYFGMGPMEATATSTMLPATTTSVPPSGSSTRTTFARRRTAVTMIAIMSSWMAPASSLPLSVQSRSASTPRTTRRKS